MDMDKHWPGPWRQGKTLVTRQTRQWSPQQIAANDAIESLAVFANFTGQDEGRSRVLIARCERASDAKLVAMAPDGLNLARLVVKYFGTDPIAAEMDADLQLKQAALAILRENDHYPSSPSTHETIPRLEGKDARAP